MAMGNVKENIKENIITELFERESEGFQAITELRQRPAIDNNVVFQAVLVKRDENGIIVLDRYDSGLITSSNTAIGGLIGGFLGILGGPIGVLLMGSCGALVGSAADTGNMIGGEVMIETVAAKLMDGEAALIILAAEEDEAVLDTVLGKFDGEIVRFDAASVAEEVDEAVKLQVEMARQAVYELRNTRHEDHVKAIEDKRSKFAEELAQYVTDNPSIK